LASSAFITALFLTALSSGNSSSSLAANAISGSVWQDQNGDGVRQASEPGIAFPVTLRLTQTGESKQTTSAAANGGYSFVGLEPGEYTVEVSVGPAAHGYATHPQRRLDGPVQTSVTLTTSDAENVDFGIFPEGMVPRFIGTVLIDGSPPASRPQVAALIGRTDCSTPHPVLPPGAGPAVYHLAVAPDELLPGCGATGLLVTFLVNGRMANETAVWEDDPSGARGLNLTVGSASSTGSTPQATSPAVTSTPPQDSSIVRPPDTGDGGLR
jgi:hypothetical protein